jgi:hypothetical protein
MHNNYNQNAGAIATTLIPNETTTKTPGQYIFDADNAQYKPTNFTDDYKDKKGRSKQNIHAALMKMYSTSPHVQKGKTEGAPAKFTERGQLPLIIPPK